MTEWVPIRYRGFWDVPRIFLARFGGQLFLFDCPFSEALDDYPEVYTIYTLPDFADDDIPQDWTTLPARATRTLGTVPVAVVRFDPTRRKAIGVEVFDALTLPPANGTHGHAQSSTPVP
ncbi:MAG TPA: hypothetical protein VFG68_22150 [Fimbriiglobus sp.]|nr:hypothetical protein [Fimbriiglobus sp.]